MQNCPAGTTPGSQKTVRAGKPAIGNLIYAFFGLLTQLVFYASHGFHMHNPMSG